MAGTTTREQTAREHLAALIATVDSAPPFTGYTTITAVDPNGVPQGGFIHAFAVGEFGSGAEPDVAYQIIAAWRS